LASNEHLERLAERVHRVASELGQLIEEQDAVMPQCWGMSPEEGLLGEGLCPAQQFADCAEVPAMGTTQGIL
jgi:hypothetical protein